MSTSNSNRKHKFACSDHFNMASFVYTFKRQLHRNAIPEQREQQDDEPSTKRICLDLDNSVEVLQSEITKKYQEKYDIDNRTVCTINESCYKSPERNRIANESFKNYNEKCKNNSANITSDSSSFLNPPHSKSNNEEICSSFLNIPKTRKIKTLCMLYID